MSAEVKGSCPIGPLKLHTLNYERDECIWCGPNSLAWKAGEWVQIGDDARAWSVHHAGEVRTV